MSDTPTAAVPAPALLERPPSAECIRLRGVRQNNLRWFDLDIPLRRLTVVTGLSGTGKSSLVFETLHAEGQRRYVFMNLSPEMRSGPQPPREVPERVDTRPPLLQTSTISCRDLPRERMRNI